MHGVDIPLSPPNSCFTGLGSSTHMANSILERMNQVKSNLQVLEVGLDLAGQSMKGPVYLGTVQKGA